MKVLHSLGMYRQKELRTSRPAKPEAKKAAPPEKVYQLGPLAPDDATAQPRFAIAKRLITKNSGLTSLSLMEALRTDRNKAATMIAEWRKLGWLVREGEVYEKPAPGKGYPEVLALIRERGSARAAEISAVLAAFDMGLSASAKWLLFHLHAGYLTQLKKGVYAAPAAEEGGSP